MEDPLPGAEKIRIEPPVKFALIVCASGIVLVGVCELDIRLYNQTSLTAKIKER